MARQARFLAVIAVAVVMAAAAFALDPGTLVTFPSLGHARGDALNYNFDLLRQAFLLNFPAASEPVRFNLTMSTATTTVSWDAASFTYDTTDNRLLVYVEGVYQIKDTDYTETSATSVTFDQPLLSGWRVMFWRW